MQGPALPGLADPDADDDAKGSSSPTRSAVDKSTFCSYSSLSRPAYHRGSAGFERAPRRRVAPERVREKRTQEMARPGNSTRVSRNGATAPSGNARPPTGSRAGSGTTEQAGRNPAQCAAAPQARKHRVEDPERSRSPSTLAGAERAERAERLSERQSPARPSPRRQTSYCGSIRERSERFRRSLCQPVRWCL